MVALDIILLLLLFSLGGMMAYSDIKTGIIPNKWIAIFAVIGVIIDIVYYAFLARDVAGLFALNVVSTFAISLILYYTHSLAGGDCKLIPVMSLLYPARMYLTYGKTSITLFVALCIAIFYGYLYLIGVSIWRIITGENRIERSYIKGFLGNYVKSYFTALVYVALVNLIFNLVNQYIQWINTWIVWLACIVTAWISGKNQKLKSRKAMIVALIIVAGLSIYEKVIPFSINPRTYFFTIVLVLCQMTIGTDLYETIPTSRIKKGMILSTFSSMAMQNSRIKGLPGISSEDLRDRITESEAESIQRWGKTPKGMNEITIVKKIPFAIFIALGYATYFIIWRIVA